MTHNVFRIVNERKSNQFLKKEWTCEEWATDPSRNSVFLEWGCDCEIRNCEIHNRKRNIWIFRIGLRNYNNQRKRIWATLISKSVFSRIGNVKKTISILMLGIQFTHCPTKYTVLLISSTIKNNSMSREWLIQINSKKFWPWLWHHFVNE